MRQIVWKRWTCALLTGLAAVGVLVCRHEPARTAEKAEPDAAAVARTRETVKMLDDVYKGFVVTITDTYVKAQQSTPAAKIVKKVFKHMDSKSWHTGRLVDASGDPLNQNNLPKGEFEKRAIAKLKDGETYYDEVGTRNGKPVLRAATAVPVVMKQCMACHPGHPQGSLLGALVYEIPIR